MFTQPIRAQAGRATRHRPPTGSQRGRPGAPGMPARRCRLQFHIAGPHLGVGPVSRRRAQAPCAATATGRRCQQLRGWPSYACAKEVSVGRQDAEEAVLDHALVGHAQDVDLGPGAAPVRRREPLGASADLLGGAAAGRAGRLQAQAPGEAYRTTLADTFAVLTLRLEIRLAGGLLRPTPDQPFAATNGHVAQKAGDRAKHDPGEDAHLVRPSTARPQRTCWTERFTLAHAGRC